MPYILSFPVVAEFDYRDHHCCIRRRPGNRRALLCRATGARDATPATGSVEACREGERSRVAIRFINPTWSSGSRRRDER